MPPFLPPELVTITFEHLYDSLCYSRAQGTYDTPIGAGFVFSNLSLVSKNWHSLALPFLVRNFKDGYGSADKATQYLRHLRKYDLSRHVESIAVYLRLKQGESSLPLVQELFKEVGPVWKPRMVEIRVYGHADSSSQEFLAAALPSFRKTNSLRLIDFGFDFLPEWIPQLPTHLVMLDYKFEVRKAGFWDLSTSLQLEIARLCSRTLRVLSIRRDTSTWMTSAVSLFKGTVFPSLTDLNLSAVWVTDFDVSHHFPKLRSAFVSLSPDVSRLHLSNLPHSLQSLTLSEITQVTLGVTVDGLNDLLLPVETLKHLGICAKVSRNLARNFFSSIYETLEHSKYCDLSDFCKDRGIQLSCYEWDPMLGDTSETTEDDPAALARIKEDRDYTEQEEEEDDSSEENEEDLDFDAEDGEEFRHLWSEDKQAQLAAEVKAVSSDDTTDGKEEKFDSILRIR
ncbi:hypothetical protein JCM3765_007889 [Sporobolomyces pararoseus]